LNIRNLVDTMLGTPSAAASLSVSILSVFGFGAASRVGLCVELRAVASRTGPPHDGIWLRLTVNGLVYAIGGDGFGTVLSAAEQYSPPVTVYNLHQELTFPERVASTTQRVTLDLPEFKIDPVGT
jgi:Kelch motif